MSEKKYKEALEKLQEALAPKNGCEISGLTRACIEEIFPELKDPEDDGIRKEIISALKYANHKGVYDKHIAWLEKQESVEEIVERCKDSWYNEGKIAGMAEGLSDDEKYQQGWHDAIEKQGEKPQGKSALEAIKEEKKVDNANKVKPKFHEGEWIVWQDKCCKVNYNGCGYELVDQNGLSTSLEYGTADENAHLWDTTKDAKDGDVLVSDNIVFIFNKIHDIWIKCHCSLYEDNSFYGGDFDLMHIKYGKEVFPATKEQCDKLFKAMADAGYVFDFAKKELKKIEQKPAWSEEDKNFMHDTISNLTELKDRYGEGYGNVGKCIDWLKSLKDRVQPQKQWKPSDAQTKALEHFVRSIGESGHVSPYDANLKLVHSLLNDLKKLREENV